MARTTWPWMPADLVDVFVKSWVDNGHLGTEGAANLAMAEVRKSPLYVHYFPGNLTPSGQVRLDESGYVAYREQAVNYMRQVGMPEGFYDEFADIGKLIEGDVSFNELRERIDDGFVAASNAPPEVRDELERLYGVTQGALAAFWLDPDRALGVIERDYVKAQIGGASKMSGFGEMRADELQRIAATGTSFDQAQEQFGRLARGQSLFNSLAGTTEDEISRDEQIAAEFFADVPAREKILKRQEGRVNKFQGGGGASASAGGLRGAGSGLS